MRRQPIHASGELRRSERLKCPDRRCERLPTSWASPPPPCRWPCGTAGRSRPARASASRRPWWRKDTSTSAAPPACAHRGPTPSGSSSTASSDPFFGPLLVSLEHALAAMGRTVFLCNSGESVERQTDFIRKMSEYNRRRRHHVTGRWQHRRGHPCAAAGDASSRVRVADHVRPAVRPRRQRRPRGIGAGGGSPLPASATAESRSSAGTRASAPVESVFAAIVRCLENASLEFDESLVRSCVPTRLAGFEAAPMDCRAPTEADRGDRIQRRRHARALRGPAARRPGSGPELRPHRSRGRGGGESCESTAHRDDGIARRDGSAGRVGAC